MEGGTQGVSLSGIKTEEDFAQQYGELGPVYGRQWRNFEGVDQLAQGC
jgi:thymidylate synthase